MQLTGDRFTSETAVFGNDLATLPDFPAEIRAPAGSLPGVSGFQVHFADHDILTPGDQPNVLVAMNPAALKVNLADLAKGGTVIVNTDAFSDRNLQKAGYATSPLEDGSLSDFHVHAVSLSSMTIEALKEVEGITSREAERSKNFFALGLMSWLYNRPIEGTLGFIDTKFAKRPEIAEANTRAFKAGWNYGETSEDFAVSYEIAPAQLEPGTYRQISGNSALTYGLIAASKLSGLPLFLGAYPITPASDVLEQLASMKHFGVRTFQAEDEIAASGAALGAAFGGSLGVTTSAGPGDRAQVGDRRARGDARAAADRRRRAARGAVDGHADEAGAGRSPDGDVRAKLGVARAGRRGLDAGRLLSRGDRSRPDRDQVPDARLPPLRRVPRQRLGAVADPGRRLAERHLDRVRDRAERRRRRLPALQARRRDTRAAVGDPGHARSRAPDRRAREGGRDRQRLLRPREPRPDGALARGEGRRHRVRTSPSWTSTIPTGRTRSCSAGARRTVRSEPQRGVCARADGRSRPRISTT